MPTVLDVFNQATVLQYINDREIAPGLGETLFPSIKIDTLELEYVKGANEAPIVASVHAFDSEAEIGDREGFEVIRQELALIKRKIQMKEKLIIALQNPRTPAELQSTVQKIYDDVDNMITSVLTKVEQMRFEALATGKLIFSENGFTGTIDYGVPSDHKTTLLTTDLWSDALATPLEDLQTWFDKIVADTGIAPQRILTSGRVASALQKHASVRSAIHGVNSDRVVSRTQLNDFLVEQGLPTIATEDRVYRVKGSNGAYTTKRYFPDNVLVLMPGGVLGNAVYGPTAEEIQLSSDPSVDISKVGNVVATVYNTNDPVAHWTKAVATALPSFPTANQVFLATVLAASV